MREIKQSDYNELCQILKDKDIMYVYEVPVTDKEVQNCLANQINRQQDKELGLNAVVLKQTGEMIG